MYWAEELANQNDDNELKEHFASVAEQLNANEEKVVSELNSVQGSAVNIGGYYYPNAKLTSAIMRPSTTLNSIVESI